MPDFTQTGRPYRVYTPLGTDKFLLRSFAGEEQVSALFRFQLELLSDDPAVEVKKVLGQPAYLELDLPGGGTRLLHGRIARFTRGGRENEMFTYRAELVPTLWFLSHDADFRVFQHQSAIDIVIAVCKELGYDDVVDKAIKKPHEREYCLQYGETVMHFVTRLLEEEGLFYYFTHTRDQHILTIADTPSTVPWVSGDHEIWLRPVGGTGGRFINDIAQEEGVAPGSITVNDYDPTTPTRRLMHTEDATPDRPGKVYLYPAKTTTLEDSEQVARRRLEREDASMSTLVGQSDCPNLQAGCRFQLKGHHAADLNTAYMLLGVSHAGNVGDVRAGGGMAGTYRNVFRAVPQNATYRPALTTARPRAFGPETAVVVGPTAGEPFTDDFGRVKIQFHWDRKGRKDNDSSCFVRVVTSWAGRQWGAIFLPRVGDEVIVDFLGGDPDRPIVVGSVYNGDQMPPYTLPDNRSQSGIKTRSIGGGASNFNELRFEDKQGSEQVVLHAERDMIVEVEHDRRKSVGNDETVSVEKNRTESVGADESITIDGNRTESVGKDESISIGKNRSESVGKDENVDVGQHRTITIAKNETMRVGETRSVQVGKDDSLQVGKNLVIDAGDAITLKTGDASISMKKNGDITIKGKNITLTGSGKINVKASSDVVVKGSKVLTN